MREHIHSYTCTQDTRARTRDAAHVRKCRKVPSPKTTSAVRTPEDARVKSAGRASAGKCLPSLQVINFVAVVCFFFAVRFVFSSFAATLEKKKADKKKINEYTKVPSAGALLSARNGHVLAWCS